MSGPARDTRRSIVDTLVRHIVAHTAAGCIPAMFAVAGRYFRVYSYPDNATVPDMRLRTMSRPGGRRSRAHSWRSAGSERPYFRKTKNRRRYELSVPVLLTQG